MILLSIQEWAKGAEVYIVCFFNAAMIIVCAFGLSFFFDQHYSNKERMDL
jgi:hypothetical protein